VLHGLDSLARAVSRRGGAVDFRRAEKIVMADHLRPGGLPQGHDIAERHQAVGVRADIIMAQVAGGHAAGFVRLNVNAIGTIVEIEIVHVVRAHIDAEAWFTWSMGTPIAFAFSRSICTSCWGSLAVKLLNRPVRSDLWWLAPTILCAIESRSWSVLR